MFESSLELWEAGNNALLAVGGRLAWPKADFLYNPGVRSLRPSVGTSTGPAQLARGGHFQDPNCRYPGFTTSSPAYGVHCSTTAIAASVNAFCICQLDC